MSQCHLQHHQVSAWDDSCSHSALVTRGVRSDGFSHHLMEFNMKKRQILFLLPPLLSGLLLAVDQDCLIWNDFPLSSLTSDPHPLGSSSPCWWHLHPSHTSIPQHLQWEVLCPKTRPPVQTQPLVFIQAPVFGPVEWESWQRAQRGFGAVQPSGIRACCISLTSHKRSSSGSSQDAEKW